MADITFKKKKDIVADITSRNKTKSGAVKSKSAPESYRQAINAITQQQLPAVAEYVQEQKNDWFLDQFDDEVVKSIQEKYKSQWGDKYYYDMFDQEDFARSLSGAMPKYLDKTYDMEDPYDQYLYRNNLPSKATFSDMYSEMAREINANRADENAYQQEYANFRNDLYKALDSARAAGEDYNEAFESAVVGLLVNPKYANVAQHFTGYDTEDVPEAGTYEYFEHQQKQSKKKPDERAFNANDLLTEYTKLLDAAIPAEVKAAQKASEDIVGVEEQITAIKRELSRDINRSHGRMTPGIKEKQAQLEALEASHEELESVISNVIGDDLSEERKAAQAVITEYASADLPDGMNWSTTVDTYWDANARNEDKRVRQDIAGLVGAAYVANGAEDSIPEILRPALEGNNFIAEMQELFQYATNDEIELFNRVIASGEDNALAFYEAFTDELQFRAVKARQDEAKKFANDNSIRASLQSITDQYGAAVEGVGNLVGSVLSDKLDIDASDIMYNSRFTDRSATTRSTVAEKIAESSANATTGDILSFLYQTGMSMADTAARMPLGGVGLAVAGSSAASNTMNSVLAQGGTIKQAAWLGGIAGVTEAVMEHIGLDRLLKAKAAGTVGGVLREMVKQAGVEGLEELGTEFVNIVADELVRADDSDLQRQVAELVAGGMTEGQALAQVLVQRLGGAALGGALSGFAFGGAGQAIRIATTPGGMETIRATLQEVSPIAAETAMKFADDVRSLGLPNRTTQNMIDAFDRIQGDPSMLMRAEGQQIAADLMQKTADLANRVSEQTHRNAAQAQKILNRQTNLYQAIIDAKAEADAALQSGDTTAHQNAAKKMRAAMQTYTQALEVDGHQQDANKAQTERQTANTEREAERIAAEATEQIEAVQEQIAVEQAVTEVQQEAVENDIVSEMVAAAAPTEQQKEYVAGINRNDSRPKLNRTQRTQLRILDGLGKKYNTKIVIEDTISHTGDDGEVYSSLSNGYYDPTDGTIHIALDAEKGAYMFFAVHELTHKVKQENPTGYQMLVDFIVERLSGNADYTGLSYNGNTLEERKQAAIKRYAKAGKHLSDEQALDEIIADAVPVILADKDTVREFVRTDRKLAQRIYEFFEDFYDALTEITANVVYGGNRQEAQALAADRETVREIADLFKSALEMTENTSFFSESAENKSDKKQYSFGGPAAKNIKKGIRWFLGADEKKRFWFSDSGSRVDFGPISRQEQFTELSNILSHEELYAHYPQLQNVRVENKQLHGPAAVVKNGIIQIDLEEIAKRADLDRHAVLLHEVQHLIQEIEGFDSGTSKNLMQLQILIEAFQKYEQGERTRRNWVSAYPKIVALYNRLGGKDLAQTRYETTLGEKEATFTEQNLRSKQSNDEIISSAINLHNEPFSDNLSSEEIDSLNVALMDYLAKYNFPLASFLEKGYTFPKNTAVGELYGLLREIYRLPKNAHDRDDGQIVPQTAPGQVFSRASSRDISVTDNQAQKAPDNGAFFDALVGNDKRSFSMKSDRTIMDDIINAETETKLAATEADLAKAREENARLSDRIDALREQFKLTKGYRPNEKALRRVARNLLKGYSSQYDLDALTEDLRGLFDFIGNQKEFDGDVVMAEANAIARKILDKSSERDDTFYNETEDARNYFRRGRFTLSDKQKAEVAHTHDSYNTFRRSLMGKLNLVNDGTLLDRNWRDISDTFPEYFDLDTNEGDQPAVIAEFLEKAYSRPYVNPFGTIYDIEDATYELASQLYDEYFRVPQVQTFADKQRGKLNEANRKYRESIEAERASYEERFQDAMALSRGMREIELRNLASKYSTAMDDQKAEYRRKYQEMVSSKNQKMADQLATFREWKQADREKRNERAETKKYRDRIEKNSRDLYRWLQNPDKKKHVPVALQNTVAKLLENIDIENKRPSQKATAWRDSVRGLSDLYKDYAAGRGELHDSGAYFSVPDAMLDALDMLTSSAESSKKLGDLTPEELRSLDLVVAVTKSAVTSVNKLYANKRYQDVSTVAERTISEVSGRKQHDYRALGKLFNVDMLDSFSWGRMLGDGAASIIDSLEKGAEKSYGKIKQGAEHVKSTLDSVGVKQRDMNTWSEKEVTIKLASGQEIRMTQAQLMSLYALSKRGQARKHMLGSGIEVAQYGKGMKQLDTFSVSETDLETMFDKLTDKQKAVMDSLQGFLSHDAAAWGNEVWMELYQYEMFGEENYWPIKSAASGTKTEDPDSVRAINAMLNIGATKALNANANNPIIVEDAFDVFSKHIAQMARLNGLAAPLEDALKWYNYVSRDENNARDYGRVTKKAIERVFGQEGNRYFLQLIKDINGLSQGSTGTEIPSKLLSAYKRSAVAGKLRVVVQQPTAILRATALVNPKFFIGESENTIKENIREMQEKNPLAWWKSQGNYEIGTGRSMRGMLFGADGTIDAITDAAMQPAGIADNLAWGALWSAVKREVKAYNKDIEVGSDAYWEKVTDRFNEVVTQTQVVDSVMHRSQIMRSKDGLTQMSTSFMSEPTKTYNMVRNSIIDVQLGRPGADKKLVKTLIALLMSIAANAAAKGLHDTLRDRGEDDDFGEMMWGKFKDNIKSDINPLGYVPYIKDAWSVIQGYDAERLDMAAVSDAWTSVQRVFKAITEGDSKYSDYKLATDLAKTVSSLTGLPLPGLIDLVNITVNTISPGALPTERKVRTEDEKEAYGALIDDGVSKRTARNIIGSYGGSNKAQKALSVAQYVEDLTEDEFDLMMEVLDIDYSKSKNKYVDWAIENGKKSLEESRKKNAKGDLKDETLEKYEDLYEEYFRLLGMMD